MKSLLLIGIGLFFHTAWAQDESSYSNNYKLREDRKVGVGVGVGGPLGAVGGLVELNIEEENAALAGFGAGSGYQTMLLAWKRSFEGEYFTPYTTVGFSHWWSAGQRSDVGRSALLKNFLTDRERAENQFGLNLATGALGMQFNQLAGEMAGSSFYIEFGGLLAIDRGELMPTGSVGAFYYF
ncbi:MAG: hypothetical protein ACK5Y2_10005 [Bdellovibrionales bacterium]